MTVLRGAQIRDYQDANGNQIVGTPKVNGKAVIEFKGRNCKVVFAASSYLHGTIVFHRDNSQVTMGDSAWLRGRITLGERCRIDMGDRFNSGPAVYMTAAENTSIHFGNDVLMARSCTIRSDDSHPIYDGTTGSRANKSKSVVVGDHVWMGQEVLVMPGAVIGSGSVLGARSLITSSRPIPENVVAVGSPAKVVRRKIVWVNKHLQMDDDIDETVDPIFPHEIEAPEIQAKPSFRDRFKFLDRIRA